MSASAPAIGRLAERLPMPRPGLAGGNEHALAQVCALVPRIVAAEAARLPSGAGAWTISRVGLTSTRMAVVMLARGDGVPAAVVKMPTSTEAAEGLGRESGVLAALRGDHRLEEWRALVPQPCAFGEVLGQPYRIDHALAGAPVVHTLHGDREHARAQAKAAAAIDALHRVTAATVRVDARLAEAWIDARLAAAFGRKWLAFHSAAVKLDALRRELHDAVDGRELRVSWVHGDYWLGNVLFAPDGDTVEGIVDWDAAAPADLPAHDILHLLLYGRRLRTGEELGLIIQRRLIGEAWSREERELLDRYGAWSDDGAPWERHVLLLYWLRHVGLHLGQQDGPGGIRRRLWEMRNVRRVLGAL